MFCYFNSLLIILKQLIEFDIATIDYQRLQFRKFKYRRILLIV